MSSYTQTLHALPPHHPVVGSRNCILVKDDIGKAKPTCRDLKPANHAYGGAVRPDKEGVRELLSSWQYHQSNPRPFNGQQDFRTLNKMAPATHTANAKSQTIQRASRRDITVTARPSVTGGRTAKYPVDHDPNFAYGIPPRPSSPINRVLSHDFLREGMEKTAERYAVYAGFKNQASVPFKIRLTHATRGHSLRASERLAVGGHQQMFKMKKFSKINARVDTNRHPHSQTQEQTYAQEHAQYAGDGEQYEHGDYDQEEYYEEE